MLLNRSKGEKKSRNLRNLSRNPSFSCGEFQQISNCCKVSSENGKGNE